MKILVLPIVLASALFVQLPSPNSDGVAMRHLHLTGRATEAHRKFWVYTLGGTPVKLGSVDDPRPYSMKIAPPELTRQG